MKLLANLARKLKSIPESDGTMLDNTMIIYISDSGNEHHGNRSQWPFVVVGGNRFKTGRYIQFPEYGQDGHRTIGNLYTTLLNTFGTRSNISATSI